MVREVYGDTIDDLRTDLDTTRSRLTMAERDLIAVRRWASEARVWMVNVTRRVNGHIPEDLKAQADDLIARAP